MQFYEGKACDAVVKRLEARHGAVRQGIWFPERVRHEAPIEMVCTVGPTLYAFEHTGIEPFEGHLKMRVLLEKHFTAIERRAAGLLPPGDFNLYFPAGATVNMKGGPVRRMQDEIVAWVARMAPTLPPLGRRPQGPLVTRAADRNVPFEVKICRSGIGLGNGGLAVGHLVDNTLEARRVKRLLRAYEKKIKQLLPWRASGARLVLILEENDLSVTNPYLVASALREIEASSEHRPDEIYLLSTANTAEWHVWVLREGEAVYDDFSVWGTSLQVIEPTSLIDLTGR